MSVSAVAAAVRRRAVATMNSCHNRSNKMLSSTSIALSSSSSSPSSCFSALVRGMSANNNDAADSNSAATPADPAANPHRTFQGVRKWDPARVEYDPRNDETVTVLIKKQNRTERDLAAARLEKPMYVPDGWTRVTKSQIMPPEPVVPEGEEAPEPTDQDDIMFFLKSFGQGEYADKFTSWEHLVNCKSKEMKHRLGIPIMARKYILKHVEDWKHGFRKTPRWRVNPNPYYTSPVTRNHDPAVPSTGAAQRVLYRRITQDPSAFWGPGVNSETARRTAKRKKLQQQRKQLSK